MALRPHQCRIVRHTHNDHALAVEAIQSRLVAELQRPGAGPATVLEAANLILRSVLPIIFIVRIRARPTTIKILPDLAGSTFCRR